MEPIIITIDGGCKGNGQPGLANCYGSMMIQYKGRPVAIKPVVWTQLATHPELMPDVLAAGGIVRFTFRSLKTNNEAEFACLLMAMKYISIIKELNGGRQIPAVIRTDSQWLIGQVWLGDKGKAEKFAAWKAAARAFVRDNGVQFEWITGEQMKASPIGH